MPMRLQEVHPSLVHFPIAFLPVAIGADLLGRLTGSRPLLETAKTAITVAAAGAAVSAATGLIAQQEVNAEGEGLDMLITHRNLNLAATAVAAGMAAWRRGRSKPTASYLALGLASIGLVTYTAYLGGHMVYELGVGVQPAGGVSDGHAPELTAAHARDVTRHAAADLVQGTRLAAKEIGEGKLAPVLTRRAAEGGEQEAPA